MAFCYFCAAEYLQRCGRRLMSLSETEILPLEREWRARLRRHDQRAHENALRATRKRLTAPGRHPDAA